MGGRAGTPPFRGVDAKIAAGFVVVVAGSFLAAQFPPSLPAQRTAVLVVAVAAYAAVAGNVPAGLATAGMAWLFCNGFLIDRLGELHWHPATCSPSSASATASSPDRGQPRTRRTSRT
jgi:hypothetical protein